MHLLSTRTGTIGDGIEAVDLGQSPADIVVISAADSELAALAQAWSGLDSRHSLRLASLLSLQHNLSVDFYLEKVIRHAELVVLRLLGGVEYWRYGLAETAEVCRQNSIPLVVLPGGPNPDPDLMAHSTYPQIECERLRQYLAAGGSENVTKFLHFCCALLGEGPLPPPARPIAKAGIFWPARSVDAVGELSKMWIAGAPCAAIIFYRSVIEGGQTAPVESLVAALAARGINPLPIYVASLKDETSVNCLRDCFAEQIPSVILNATSFAISAGANGGPDDPLARCDCPVLQVVFAGTTENSWRESSQGLSARDLAMNVVLPELDGRIASRAVSFKAEDHWDERTQCRIATYKPLGDRVEFVAEQVRQWIMLQKTPRSERKIAIILANYPNKDGRIGNGVGYDTPASTVAVLNALRTTGYSVGDVPSDGNALIEALQDGPTNSSRRNSDTTFSIADYRECFSGLPKTVQSAVKDRWGEPENDPFFRQKTFHLPVKQYGKAIVAIQPARGYNIDPKSTYHDPALVPPHGYFAFYFWIRHGFGAHALIHNGKHGNLEWLPGKATALSASCYPEAVLGPLPQLYPFIVNDPGEGTQAKRRTSAVIIDHLTPPLTRAESYGALKDLEALIDEYYLASGLDRRRLVALRKEIFDITRGSRLDIDAGLTGDDDSDLQKLDAYLCDLKEAQIRDGLHILGFSPQGRNEADLLVALTRVPRALGEAGDQSLTRALAGDLGLGNFDPLGCAMADPWNGPRPKQLVEMSGEPWRTNGDTVERLEMLANRCVSAVAGSSSAACASVGPKTNFVLERIAVSVLPALRACGEQEITALLHGLDGKFVAPGPSGAPTRGRLDVLPTGRNFYSLDNRSVPTPTAWTLGQKSAEELVTRHFQDFGAYPKAVGISAWGTSNMRTGGDDIAQALALIGAKPVWEPASWRVTGFEILPPAKLGRPRVDVTLRISGFFRDAFPQQIELLDKALRAVGDLDEDDEDNPISARMHAEATMLHKAGVPLDEARHAAGHRIFGSKPGAYGAGLQALIDERTWAERADLAKAYVIWGSYAYGARDNGVHDERAFGERLKRIEAVVHNQDNREHDLLDSDDYYQFEGGMSAAVEVASGRQPRIYHNDHSRPERPVVRTLEEEVGRVMRSRVVNPKWIAGVKRHGYKGAFEIAATIDYMFAFAATTGAVKTHHFDLAYDAFIDDDATRDFIAANNPAALAEIARRFDEAIVRGLWSPRSNSAYDRLRALSMETTR